MSIPPPSPTAENYEFLMEEYEENMRAQREYEEEGEDIFPTPAYVLKVKAEEIDGEPQKVFVNVCHSESIGDPVVEEVDGEEQPRLRVPVSCGPPRADVDKSGKPSAVFDVVFSDAAVERAVADREFRDVLSGFAVDNLERKHGFQCTRSFKYPKMLFKQGGAERPPPHRIRKARPAGAGGASKKEKAAVKKKAKKAKKKQQQQQKLQLLAVETASPASSKPNTPRSVRFASREMPGFTVSPPPPEELPYEFDFMFTTSAGAKKAPFEELARNEVPPQMQCVVYVPDIESVGELDIQTSVVDLLVQPADGRNEGIFLELPFVVDESATKAKFSRTKRKLTVTFRPVAIPEGADWGQAEEEAPPAAKEAEKEKEEKAVEEKEKEPEKVPEPEEEPPAPPAIRPQEGAAKIEAPKRAGQRIAFESTMMYDLCL